MFCVYSYCRRYPRLPYVPGSFIRPATKPLAICLSFHHRTREIDQISRQKINMSRVYKLLSTTVRPSVTQSKRRPQARRRPFARFVSTRRPVSEVTCVMCLNDSRRFRARVRLAFGGTALFIRSSLEKTGLWRPLLNLLSSSVGVTAAKVIGISLFKLIN